MFDQKFIIKLNKLQNLIITKTLEDIELYQRHDQNDKIIISNMFLEMFDLIDDQIKMYDEFNFTSVNEAKNALKRQNELNQKFLKKYNQIKDKNFTFDFMDTIINAEEPVNLILNYAKNTFLKDAEYYTIEDQVFRGKSMLILNFYFQF